MSDKIRKYVLSTSPTSCILVLLKGGDGLPHGRRSRFRHEARRHDGKLSLRPLKLPSGLGGLDLLVGLTGAVGMYLLVQSKIRKGKSSAVRKNMAPARWGTAKDIKPFVDPVFKNNVILTGTEFLTLNTRPKNPGQRPNLNACAIGSSGSEKQDSG